MNALVRSALPPPGRVAARDRVLAPVLALSILLHVALILSLLPSHHKDPVAPREIPIEVVQIPEARPKAAKPEPPKPAQAKREQAKQEQPKKQQATREQPRSPRAKPAQQKPIPPTTTGSDRMERLLGSMPAIALPASAETGTDMVSFRQLVLSQVAKAKKEGKSFGIPGSASVSFTLGDQGELVRCELVGKSVDPKLDAEAVAMVRRGAPYPAPPPGTDRHFVITLRFSEAP